MRRERCFFDSREETSANLSTALFAQPPPPPPPSSSTTLLLHHLPPSRHLPLLHPDLCRGPRLQPGVPGPRERARRVDLRHGRDRPGAGGHRGQAVARARGPREEGGLGEAEVRGADREGEERGEGGSQEEGRRRSQGGGREYGDESLKREGEKKVFFFFFYPLAFPLFSRPMFPPG